MVGMTLGKLPVVRNTSGPLNIGGKAWWKFSKIWLLCTDKISKISSKMFGLQQAWAPKVKICSDWPSGLQKTQNCLDGAIRPRKQPISFGLTILGPSGLENGSHGPWTTIQQLTVCMESRLSHSAPSCLHYLPRLTSLGPSCVPRQQPLRLSERLEVLFALGFPCHRGWAFILVRVRRNRSEIIINYMLQISM